MRMLLDITIPHEPFNSLVRKGVVGKKLAGILEELKPEAIYFSEHDADVKFRIAMTPEDLKKAGLDALGKKWA